MKTKLTIISGALILVAAVVPSGNAQVFKPAPPAGFNAAVASDAELDEYGFPPRPDGSQPEAYAHWLKVVTAPQTRLANPKAETTNLFSESVRALREQSIVGSNASATSENWSGYAIEVANGTFTANKSTVVSEYTVPGMGNDNCSYGPYYMVQWVGFDGATNGDVLQAGTLSTTCSTSYYAWYEWYEQGCTSSSASYPCNVTTLNLTINPGDLVETEVWYTTAAPKGHAYILDYTAKTSLGVAFNQPSGSATYEGNSVEWIVERPGTSSGLADLANYLGTGSTNNYAYNGSYYYPSSTPSGSTTLNITMVCPPWNPSSSCSSTTDLSYVKLYGTNALWFFDEGPAKQ